MYTVNYNYVSYYNSANYRQQLDKNLFQLKMYQDHMYSVETVKDVSSACNLSEKIEELFGKSYENQKQRRANE